MDALIDIQQAADLLEVSTGRVRQLRESGELTGYKNKVGRLRFSHAQVLALAKSRETFTPEKRAS